MGVSGLLPTLQSISRPSSLERYQGLNVAVDAMCWLHRGVHAADVSVLAKAQYQKWHHVGKHGLESKSYLRKDGDQIAQRLDFEKLASSMTPTLYQLRDNEEKEKAEIFKCVSYVVRNVETLKNKYKMFVVLVIDGASLPVKNDINESRRIERQQSYEKALKAEEKGDRRNARKLYSRSCSVTHEMRHELIQECKRRDISYLVSPYEADAQMSRLAHAGHVDLVITEDSDLLVYGCPRVLFKLDFQTFRGEEVQLMRDLASNDSPSFQNWSHDMFVYMCILSGCDYCSGIFGIGINTAHKLVRINRTPTRIFNALRNAGRLPDGFEESFWMAYRTFRHQRVYCPETKSIQNLFPIESETDTRSNAWDYLGPWFDPATAQGVADGTLHPTNKKPWRIYLAEKKMNTSCVEHESKVVSGGEKKIHDNVRTNEMFSFFGKKRKTSSAIEQSPQYFEAYSIDNKATYLPETRNNSQSKSRTMASIPRHPHEYSSKLVGESFRTLSRRKHGKFRLRHNFRNAFETRTHQRLKSSRGDASAISVNSVNGGDDIGMQRHIKTKRSFGGQQQRSQAGVFHSADMPSVDATSQPISEDLRLHGYNQDGTSVLHDFAEDQGFETVSNQSFDQRHSGIGEHYLHDTTNCAQERMPARMKMTYDVPSSYDTYAKSGANDYTDKHQPDFAYIKDDWASLGQPSLSYGKKQDTNLRHRYKDQVTTSYSSRMRSASNLHIDDQREDLFKELNHDTYGYDIASSTIDSIQNAPNLSFPSRDLGDHQVYGDSTYSDTTMNPQRYLEDPGLLNGGRKLHGMVSNSRLQGIRNESSYVDACPHALEMSHKEDDAFADVNCLLQIAKFQKL